MTHWEGRRVLVTGAHGFLGSHVVEELVRRGADWIDAPKHSELFDLTQQGAAEQFITPDTDTVIHLAARVGGIGANMLHPWDFFNANLQMGLNVLNAAINRGVRKVIIVGTVCGYPRNAPQPMREVNLWQGYPEPTNAPYGIAKKALHVGMKAAVEQGLIESGVFLLPTNLYGPRDDFDPRTSHVIPAMIRKMCDSARTEMPCKLWGTGRATRDFLFVEDAARGILDAAEKYDWTDAVNLGTGEEIDMLDLALLIAEKVGFDGPFYWNTDMPDGQPRRCLDVTRAYERFGWQATTTLKEGIARTVEWWRK